MYMYFFSSGTHTMLFSALVYSSVSNKLPCLSRVASAVRPLACLSCERQEPSPSGTTYTASRPWSAVGGVPPRE